MAPPYYDFAGARVRADRMIRKFGGPEKKVLRRDAGDRFCVAAIQNYTMRERIGAKLDPTDMLCMISALDPGTGKELSPAPDSEQDSVLVLNDDGTELERYRVVAPILPVGTDNRVAVYWRAQVRKY